jgi:hypothetical protein
VSYATQTSQRGACTHAAYTRACACCRIGAARARTRSAALVVSSGAGRSTPSGCQSSRSQSQGRAGMARPGIEPETPRFSGTGNRSRKRQESPANRRVADRACSAPIPVDCCSCSRVKDVAGRATSFSPAERTRLPSATRRSSSSRLGWHEGPELGAQRQAHTPRRRRHLVVCDHSVFAPLNDLARPLDRCLSPVGEMAVERRIDGSTREAVFGGVHTPPHEFIDCAVAAEPVAGDRLPLSTIGSRRPH